MFNPSISTKLCCAVFFSVLIIVASASAQIALDERYKAAISHLKSSEYREAKDILAILERDFPNDRFVLSALGATYSALGDFKNALDITDRLLRIEPKSANVHFNRCGVLANLGRIEESIQSCEIAMSLNPEEPRYATLFASLKRSSDRSEDALAVLQNYLSRFRDDISLLALLGDHYFTQNDYQTAAAYYEEILRIDPEFSSTYLSLSKAYFYLNDLQKAIEYARRFTEHQPNFFYGHYNLGTILRHSGFTDEAIAPFTAGVELDPKCSECHFLLGESYETKAIRNKTLEHLKAAYDLEPDKLTYVYKLGRTLFTYHHYDESIVLYEKADRISPENLEIMGALGLAYFESTNFDKAISILEKAERLYPGNATIKMFLEVSHARKGSATRLSEYKAQVASNPKDTVARMRLAEAYRFTGQFELAEKEYIFFTETFPNDYRPFTNLGVFYSEGKQYEKALAAHQKAAKLHRHHVIYLSIASTYESLGNIAEALNAAKTAVEIKSDSLESQLRLGELYELTGDREGAIRAFTAAHNVRPNEPSPIFRLAFLNIKIRNKEAAVRYYHLLKNITPNTVQKLENNIIAAFGLNSIN